MTHESCLRGVDCLNSLVNQQRLLVGKTLPSVGRKMRARGYAITMW